MARRTVKPDRVALSAPALHAPFAGTLRDAGAGVPLCFRSTNGNRTKAVRIRHAAGAVLELPSAPASRRAPLEQGQGKQWVWPRRLLRGTLGFFVKHATSGLLRLGQFR
jgi:hypothetical protein